MPNLLPRDAAGPEELEEAEETAPRPRQKPEEDPAERKSHPALPRAGQCGCLSPSSAGFRKSDRFSVSGRL